MPGPQLKNVNQKPKEVCFQDFFFCWKLLHSSFYQVICIDEDEPLPLTQLSERMDFFELLQAKKTTYRILVLFVWKFPHNYKTKPAKRAWAAEPSPEGAPVNQVYWEKVLQRCPCVMFSFHFRFWRTSQIHSQSRTPKSKRNLRRLLSGRMVGEKNKFHRSIHSIPLPSHHESATSNKEACY